MNAWKRDGLSYYCTVNVYVNNRKLGSMHNRMNFIHYHILFFFGGKKKLQNMAKDIYMMGP